MQQAREYKCPNCGGGVTFDSSTQQMKCPYCDTTFEMDAVKEFQDADWAQGGDNCEWEPYDQQSGSGDWTGAETSQMRQFRCQSCGGEIVTDASTAATSCPYCGNAAIMEERLSGMFRPDYVIPFQLNQQQAQDALAKHLKGKLFLPTAFKTKSRMEEIKGVYVPFWLFDTDATAHARYRCTKIRRWSDAHYDYIKTSHFAVRRSGRAAFEAVPVDGSSKMDDAMMEAIEPFDYSKKMDFQTAYLSGFLADKYDVDAAQSQPRANERIRNSMQELLRDTVQGYSTCAQEGCNVQFRGGKTQYALLPVWVLNSSYQGKVYHFAMNGQSGKFIGDLPLDKAKAALYTAGVFAAVSLVTGLLACFM